MLLVDFNNTHLNYNFPRETFSLDMLGSSVLLETRRKSLRIVTVYAIYKNIGNLTSVVTSYLIWALSILKIF